MGSLFTVGVVTADDIHRCLEALTGHMIESERLCAMHALVVQANDKLCKSKSAPFIQRFQESLSVYLPTIDTQSEESQFFQLLVVVSLTSHFPAEANYLTQNMLNTIDRWFAAQSVKRMRSSPNTGMDPKPSSRALRIRRIGKTRVVDKP
jgi:hypothetical protein